MVFFDKQDWDSSVSEFDDITQQQRIAPTGSTPLVQGVLDTTATRKSLSLESGLITLVVRGDQRIFTSPMTSRYTRSVPTPTD